MRYIPIRLLGLVALSASLCALALASSASAATVTLTRVSPASAPEFTSVLVKIRGSGFDTAPGSTTVSFGGTAATGVTCESSSRCTAMSPELGVGSVEVTATVEGVSSTGGPLFTYGTYSPPTDEIVPGDAGFKFSKASLTDRYPAIFTPGNIYLNIYNATDETQGINGPTGPVSLPAGDTEGYNLPVRESSPYLFQLYKYPHKKLTLKTQTPQ